MIYIVSPGGTREKGGMGRVVDNVTSDLAKHRPDVRFTVVDTYGPGRFHLMPFYFLLACLRLATSFAGGRAQLAHVHMADYGSVLRKGIVLAIARAFRVPVVLHMHAGRFPDQYRNSSRLARFGIRKVIGMADEVVVLGDYWRRFMQEEFQGIANRVTVLHNAVPGPAALAPRAPTPDPVRLLFLGRLIPLKGIAYLLEALATDALKARDWRLTIAGDGDLEAHRRKVAEAGIADRVHFTGWLSQEGCRQELAKADVLVQPSLFEGLPMSVLEGMAHGLAVVATPVGAVPDAVEDGVTGLLVPPGESAPLADALCRVIDDAELRARLGAGARTRFETQFDMPVCRDRIVELYRRNARFWPADADTTTASFAARGAR
ncbi:glycosyltransferase family 4 protein [Azospirillum sp. RWY-5-1]|uniref:Glycosyltransferase family 4 protein n=1 Tax=Azospirillum oleiclasticum TaxID=2735135 RepID=A0ABX2TDX8_9PROT|nr:glycosyltransferase family 4 protein [Azospirillum oleiclasticum]NYZ17962.1 glycosyltransferase family 4 protein [Azospirillum oleiclasticum]NYZ22411.1 glycosyltransferase family 4 protein [Azospirillum oleiclasticum]